MRNTARESVKAVGKGDMAYVIDNYFGGVGVRGEGPQVYLVHQSAGTVTAPHFHRVPQFQVFTGSAGKLARHVVAAPTLHYADAWTSYGPIMAGEHGIDYFTARIHSDVGAGYMPESRKSKPQKSGRHFTVQLDAVTPDAGTGAEREDPEIISLIDEQEDGLAARLVRISPEQCAELPAFAGSGRLITVLNGTLVDDDGEYERWAWGHETAGTPPSVLMAGASGAVVLCCDYPIFTPNQAAAAN